LRAAEEAGRQGPPGSPRRPWHPLERPGTRQRYSPMIRFACPRCRAVLEAPDKKAGLAVPCPRCTQHVTVPAPVAGVPLAVPRDEPAQTVPVTCPGCGRHIDQPTEKAGAMIECARCDTRFIAAPKGQAEKERPASVNIGQEVGQNIGQAEGRAWLPGEGDLQPNRM